LRQTRAITEGAVMLAVFTILLLITLYFPILSLISTFFLPLPFFLYNVRHSEKNSLPFFLAALVLSFIAGNVVGISLAFTYGAVGWTMGWLVKKKESWNTTLLVSSLVFALSTVIQYAIAVTVFQFDFIKETMTLVRSSYEQSIQLLKRLGQQPPADMMNQINDMLELIQTLIPSFIVMASIMAVFFIQLILFPIVRRFQVEVPKRTPFRNIQMPKNILWYYLVTLVLTLVLNPEKGTTMFWVLFNLATIFGLLLFIQGCSFLLYYRYQKKLPTVFSFIFVLFALLFLPLVRLLGIIDLGFDLRKRIQTKA
jgi:uncharacterized protein YybS (DUF2232 family)